MRVVLPALAVVLVFALWSVAAVTAQLRCVDAALVAARAVAPRGGARLGAGGAPPRAESASLSVGVSRASAPKGARIVVSRSGDLVVVEVHAGVRLPGPWSGS